MNFCKQYDHHFIGKGRNSVVHARHYLTGLMGTQRSKNMETFENDVVDSDYQGMEQFISSSPWDHRALLDDVAKNASEAIGDDNETGLNIDESSFLKKGDSSVGVQRQWSGRVGKVENCQVAVFASLGRNDEFALIDVQLYLPQSWVDDPDRCAKAKIPEEHRVYQPKWQQALDMVKRARANHVKFGWVGADALYGNNHKFLNALEDSGECFMADIHANRKVWLERPTLDCQPPVKGKRGRPATRSKLKSTTNPSLYQRVDKICQDNFEEHSVEVSFRQGSKGALTGRFYIRSVWLWDETDEGPPRERRLLVREDESGDLKYSLTNLPAETSLKRLAYIQGQRYWIEHGRIQTVSEYLEDGVRLSELICC